VSVAEKALCPLQSSAAEVCLQLLRYQKWLWAVTECDEPLAGAGLSAGLLADSCKAKAGVSQDEARGSLAVGTGQLRQDQAQAAWLATTLREVWQKTRAARMHCPC
jgi:hypothetical protein